LDERAPPGTSSEESTTPSGIVPVRRDPFAPDSQRIGGLDHGTNRPGSPFTEQSGPATACIGRDRLLLLAEFGSRQPARQD
jgi:hypothetical protein